MLRWLLFLMLPMSASAAPLAIAHLDSPTRILRVTVELDDGRLGYRIDRLGEPVIAHSRLGFLLRSGRLERDLELTGQSTSSSTTSSPSS